MNGSEGALWEMTRSRLGRYGFLKRIENSIDEGTADVSYCLRPSPVREAVSGWLELKHLYAWPVRASTPVVVDHLTREQVLFLQGWRAAGGQAHVLMQVKRTYLLLDVDVVRALFRRELTRPALLAVASIVGQDRFPTREIVAHLTQS